LAQRSGRASAGVV